MLAAAITILSALSIASIVLAVLNIVANWKIFTKAGEKGWKVLIPIYNLYIQCKLFWNRKAFAGMMAAAVGTGVFYGLATSLNMPALAAIGSVGSIATLVMEIVILCKMAKCFGKGTGFKLGLVFLEPIFTMILGFGKAEYTAA